MIQVVLKVRGFGTDIALYFYEGSVDIW